MMTIPSWQGPLSRVALNKRRSSSLEAQNSDSSDLGHWGSTFGRHWHICYSHLDVVHWSLLLFTRYETHGRALLRCFSAARRNLVSINPQHAGPWRQWSNGQNNGQTPSQKTLRNAAWGNLGQLGKCSTVIHGTQSPVILFIFLSLLWHWGAEEIRQQRVPFNMDSECHTTMSNIIHLVCMC